LTEARVIIPGGQALLGFQFVAMLTKSFSDLPPAAQYCRAAALCAVALAVTLLMTPAALHRLAFAGESSSRFLKIASSLVVAACIPLAAGIAADVGVVFLKVTASSEMAVVAGISAFVALFGLWIGYPLAQRAQLQPTARLNSPM
jgi:Family of unknown function (DUF6328)